MVSDDIHAVLIDFGLSTVLAEEHPEITSSVAKAGNPRWMAPELFMGETSVSVASDVWALGMVLLEVRSHLY